MWFKPPHLSWDGGNYKGASEPYMELEDMRTLEKEAGAFGPPAGARSGGDGEEEEEMAVMAANDVSSSGGGSGRATTAAAVGFQQAVESSAPGANPQPGIMAAPAEERAFEDALWERLSSLDPMLAKLVGSGRSQGVTLKRNNGSGSAGGGARGQKGRELA